MGFTLGRAVKYDQDVSVGAVRGRVLGERAREEKPLDLDTRLGGSFSQKNLIDAVCVFIGDVEDGGKRKDDGREKGGTGGEEDHCFRILGRKLLVSSRGFLHVSKY